MLQNASGLKYASEKKSQKCALNSVFVSFFRRNSDCWKSSDACACIYTKAPTTSWRASAREFSSRNIWRSSIPNFRACWTMTRTKVGAEGRKFTCTSESNRTHRLLFIFTDCRSWHPGNTVIAYTHSICLTMYAVFRSAQSIDRTVVDLRILWIHRMCSNLSIGLGLG